MSDFRIKEYSGDYIIQQKQEDTSSYSGQDVITWTDVSAGPLITADVDSYITPQTCKGCKRIGELTNRNLCEECDTKIPNHIPEEQYITYMKELWRKK